MRAHSMSTWGVRTRKRKRRRMTFRERMMLYVLIGAAADLIACMLYFALVPRALPRITALFVGMGMVACIQIAWPVVWDYIRNGYEDE